MVEAEQHPQDLSEDKLQIFLSFCRWFNEDYLCEVVICCSRKCAFDLTADVSKRGLYLLLMLLHPDNVAIAIRLTLWQLRCNRAHRGQVVKCKAYLEAVAVRWASQVEDEGFPLAKDQRPILAATGSH